MQSLNRKAHRSTKWIAYITNDYVTQQKIISGKEPTERCTYVNVGRLNNGLKTNKLYHRVVCVQ